MCDLRVLLITETSAAGVGRHVLDLAEGLLRRGCQTHLIYSGRRQDDVFRRRLGELRRLRTCRVQMRRGPHPSDLRAIRRLRAYLRIHGPFDVIHGQSSKGGAIARLAGRSDGASLVYTPHCVFTMNPMIGRLASSAFRAIERRLARGTDAIVAVSPEEAHHLLKLGIPTGKVHCIPNGIAPRYWTGRREARRATRLPQHGVVIGFLGRFCAQKNPRLMIESFAEMAPGPSGPYLAMVGNGPLETALRRLVDALGVGPRVFWPGYHTAEQAMPAFDVFALPSCYEGMPYVLLEALSAGLPIVATNVGGTRMVIEPGANGYVVERHKPDAFAAKLALLTEDAARRRRFGDVSRQLARSFSAETMVEQTYELYRRLRAPHARPPAPREGSTIRLTLSGQALR